MTVEKKIISVSRRTDVPAFYAEWLMRRLHEGRAAFLHPFTREKIEVELSPERVAAIVFWTKNFQPMLERLAEMENLGFSRYLVHYTITGLGSSWEPRVPVTEEALDAILELSGRIGAERVLWRFDPMVITEKITVERTLERFAALSEKLAGRVLRCFVSLMAPYAKIRKRVQAYENERHDRVRTPEPEEVMALALGLAELGRKAGIAVHACCTPELLGFGVLPASCVDTPYLLSLWPELGIKPEPAATRKGCGCHRSIDLGAYDTCPHTCLYCYANSHESLILKRRAAHRPENFCLVQ